MKLKSGVVCSRCERRFRFTRLTHVLALLFAIIPYVFLFEETFGTFWESVGAAVVAVVLSGCLYAGSLLLFGQLDVKAERARI